MKSRAKTTLKFLSLSIVLSCFVLGVYAQSKYSNILALETKTSKHKTQLRIDNNTELKLAIRDDSKLAEGNKKLENWMLDKKFWKTVKKYEWEEEPIEQPREIEDWMITLKVKRVGCVDIFSDFKEKPWMKEQSFLIL